jgi:Leucine-rich repeat (LRR) protein
LPKEDKIIVAAKNDNNADNEKVRARIEKSRKRKAKSLSLSDYRELDTIPDLSGLETLEQFLVYESCIKSLGPLAALKNLKRLYAVKSQVTDISGIADLKYLTQLYLWGNPELEDLTPLRNLSRLRLLVLSSTAITDLSPLSDLHNLSQLRLEGTQIRDLSPLANLRSLFSLELTGTDVEDISVIKSLPSLRVLMVNGTKVRDFSVLSDIKYLTSLDVSNTAISNLDPIVQMAFMGELKFSKTSVSDLAPISKLKYLKEIDASGTAISDLKPIAYLKNLRRIILDKSLVTDLSPLANMESLYGLGEQYYFGGASFLGAPISDPNVVQYATMDNPERTRKTLNYLRSQVGLPPLGSKEQVFDSDENDLKPIDNVPSAFGFGLAKNGSIVLEGSQSNLPAFPLRTSEREFLQRLEVCRTVAKDLVDDLSGNKFQARTDYLQSLINYRERLPISKSEGNILLADAEARTLRNLFAGEADILSVPFAAKLKTFLEQHIGLRVFYPEIANFYHDVQTGRIETPLSLDAIEGFVQTVREHTPSVFDGSVEEALEGSTDIAKSFPSTTSPDGGGQSLQPMPPKDPLGDIDPAKAADLTFAGTANSLWKVFLQGEKIYNSMSAWKNAGAALRPHIAEILNWLQRFMPPSGGP